MKFFTRDLYRRCRSSDEGIVNAACDEWEQTNENYEAHLRTVATRLPTNIREFLELLLHDAKVQSIAREGERLIAVLQKDIPPRDLVVLSYELDGEPTLEPFAESPDDWSKPTTFEFDEFEVQEEGGRTSYTQSIVFGNGWLMRLRFRDVHVTLAQPLYPAVAATAAARSRVVESA